MSNLVILAASVFEVSCGKQTDGQTDVRKHTRATAVSVGNKSTNYIEIRSSKK